MAKKLFGKRFVAILATLALLLSMAVMVGSFAVSAESAYTPKRAVTFTTSEGIQQSTFMLQDAWMVAAGKEVTIKGYYKIDSISGSKFELLGGAVVVTEATDGWVEFSVPYTVPSAAEWKAFGFWEAAGTFALADITFEDADGNVLYDLATDAALPAGTYTGWAQHSIWYILGNYGTCADGSSCTVVVDDVYTPPYEPKRAVTFTTSEGIQQSTFMLQDAWMVAAGKEVTIKGYYKIDSISGSKFELLGGAVVVTEATDGWVEFSVPYTVPSAAEWKAFGFWEAAGTFALADITFEDADGNVLYDLATDAALPAGTYTGWAQHSIWYILGNYGTCADGSSCTVVVDDVYTPPVYTPKRVLSATGVNSEVNAKIAFYSGSLGLTNGAKATIKGYYKVDDFKLLSAGNAIFIGTNTDSRIAVTDNTDGWVEFELTFTVGAIIYFEHFYTQGTLSLADLVIEDTEGKKYELATDASLPESDHTGVYDDGKWYTGFYNKADDAIFHFDKAIGNEVPPAPPINAVETPEIPNLLEQDATGYGPNRAFGIINTKDEMPVANFAVWAEDYFVTSDKYYVFAHVKVSGFEAFEGATDAACQIEMLAGENPAQIIGSWNANTEGWVALVDENGDPISFEKLTMADSFVLNFSVKNAKANFIIGDLIIADAAGNIVYSLANDKMLNLESDMRYTTSTDWNATPYVANPEGPTLFPIQTKGNEAYVPNVGISIAPDPFHKTSETSIIIMTNAAPFVPGETYTIHGKMFVSIEGGFCGNANPKFDFTSHTLGPIGSASVLDTCGGWVSLVYPNGDPIVFKGTESLDYVKFNLFNAYGALAVADIYITDSQGNVVYDMAKDEILIGQAGDFESEGFVDKGAIWRIVLNNYAVGEIYVNEAPVEHTAADYGVPTFVETVTVPGNDEVPPTSGMAVLSVVVLSMMSASGAAILTLKKKEN